MGLFDELMGPSPVPEIKDDTPHYEAVGRFVTTFATAEASVHMLARHLSGLSDEKARIIFGGMRLPDITDIIRQIAKIDSLDAKVLETIENCLIQIGLIAKRRHIIVHRSSYVFDGRIIATNVFTSKSILSSEQDTFDVTELSNMQSDCRRIYLRLARIYSPKDHPIDADPLAEAMLYGFAWRYKHVPPKTPNLKPRSKSAKPKRQPPASRGKSD
jgi:hypothetical protein